MSLPWPFTRQNSSGTPSSSSTQRRPLSPLLRHYETPGVIPPTARMSPSIKRQVTRPIHLWDVWRYGAFVVTKATTLAFDLVTHHVWGPRKKSWGLEMTIITSIMRDAGRSTSLVDIHTIRMLMSIAGLVPLPSDALVTPVTFRVRPRKLRGILSEYDAKEPGTRELSGEWVVGKGLWQRLQAEWKAARSAREGKDSSDPPKHTKQKEHVILYLHGGAYYTSSAAAQRLITIPLSKYTDSRVFALDYRLAPETHFPGPLHDAVCGYLRLVMDLNIPPENIVLAGDSAGGGLSLALLMYLRDNNYPLPSGAILMSPWVDLTMSCDSWDSNAPYDVVPICAPDDHLNPVAIYLGDKMEQYLTHPYASPLFGDFRGLPPLLIQAGEAEVLRDEITLLAHKASLANVEVRHELYEDAIHVFHAFPFLDASHRAFKSCREFIRHELRWLMQGRLLRPLDGAAEAVLEGEIDNDKARVVGGDGVEVAPELQEEAKHRCLEEVSTEGGQSEDVVTTESETDEEGTGVRKAGVGAYPSWGRSRPNSTHNMDRPSSPSTTDDEAGSDGSDRVPGGAGATRATPSQRVLKPKPSWTTPKPELSGSQALRRIHSALSLILPESSHSTHPPSPPRRVGSSSSPKPRRNSLSHQHQYQSHRRTAVVPLPPVSTSPPLPSPSIRRVCISHPDITSLV